MKYLLLCVMLLSGCAGYPTCTIGIGIFGIAPIPYMSCDFTIEPQEVEEDD